MTEAGKYLVQPALVFDAGPAVAPAIVDELYRLPGVELERPIAVLDADIRNCPPKNVTPSFNCELKTRNLTTEVIVFPDMRAVWAHKDKKPKQIVIILPIHEIFSGRPEETDDLGATLVRGFGNDLKVWFVNQHGDTIIPGHEVVKRLGVVDSFQGFWTTRAYRINNMGQKGQPRKFAA